MGRDLWPPTPSQALLSGWCYFRKAPSSQVSPSQCLVLRPSCWGPTCHLERMVLKIKQMISWVVLGVAAFSVRDQHNTGASCFLCFSRVALSSKSTLLKTMSTKITSLFTNDSENPLRKNVSKERLSLCQPSYLEVPFCLLKNSPWESNRRSSVSHHGCCWNILQPHNNLNGPKKGTFGIIWHIVVAQQILAECSLSVGKTLTL